MCSLVIMAPWMSSFFFAFILILSSYIAAQPMAHLSTTWTNDESSIRSISFIHDGSSMRYIFPMEDGIPTSTCGFFCNGDCTSYLFAIILVLPSNTDPQPHVIWSANRDYPVREGAILNFTAAGELVLQDVDGSIVWTTNTTGKSTAGMKLTHKGSLVLFDVHNSTVWQSFDHPTDCVVAGQKLYSGQKLIPSVSSTNWTSKKNSYSLQVTDVGLFAYVESNPPQVYYHKPPEFGGVRYVEFSNGGLSYVLLIDQTGYLDQSGYLYRSSHPFLPVFPSDFKFRYMRLMPDGQLKAFGHDQQVGWETKVADLLSGPPEECFYPFSCGRNAICLADKQCSCPGMDSFRVVNDRQPNMGCSQVTPLTCNATQHQHFIELKNIQYFTYTADMEDVDTETCKQKCLNNCSCKAAIFEYNGSDFLSGDCYLLTEIFTMTSVDKDVTRPNTSAFIKVQNVSSTPSTSSETNTARILGSAIGSSVLLLIVVVGFIKFIVRKQKKDSEIEEEYLDQVPGLPTRFSYEQLKTATHNFTKKLGEGGFGSVFQGTLEDGSRIAVKCLQSLVHVKKSFLAEVESIGSIHHVNLVRLRGFCAWNSERLLVYEFMSNGSLDQWIYNGDRKHLLGWECRKKIILDIAKGLAYLHEECRQKIIHLDIKPQNILLDEDFNAKVSDFGLSKLIDRDQSQVITKMRGTPGYMAPECVGSCITEKVDVYSFGIVVLEILCGRKNFDRSQPEEDWHLLYVFQRCWEEETLLDIVDMSSEDMQVHRTEVMEIMKVASWCLQINFTKRPSMSSVVKVLDGVMNVESNLDYNFLYPRLQNTTDEGENSSKPMLPSILSGPR